MARILVNFFAAGIPPTGTFQAKEPIVRRGRGGRRHLSIGKSASAREMEAQWDSLLAPHADRYGTIDVPCQLDVVVAYPFPPTRAINLTMSPEEAQADWEWMPVKPDASNVLKGLEDRLVCFGLLKDDAIVVDARIRKIRSHTVGVTIRISEAAR